MGKNKASHNKKNGSGTSATKAAQTPTGIRSGSVQRQGSFPGILIGAAIAVLIFVFAGGQRVNTDNWIRTTGTIAAAYHESVFDSGKPTGDYADITFEKNDELVTETATRLNHALTDEVGGTVDILYNPAGSGVEVVGNTHSGAGAILDYVLIFGILIFVYVTSTMLKNKVAASRQTNR